MNIQQVPGTDPPLETTPISERMVEENIKLRETINRQHIELEAKNRQLDIEAALERTRTRVMAMYRSEDLDETSLVFGEQLRGLGIEWQFSYFWLIEEDKDEHTFWITWPDKKTSTTRYSLAEADETFMNCIDAWKRQDKIHCTYVPPPDVQGWLDTFERITIDAGGEAINVMRADNFKDGVYYYDAMMKFGSLGILMNRPISEEEKHIQSRFATEFERAYTRFLDLKKAEAQARAAQIEVAVEKVRAKALSMYRSEDLHGVVVELKKQLNGLQIENVTAVSMYLEQDDGSIRGIDLSGVSDADDENAAFRMDVVFNLADTDPKLWIRKIWNTNEDYFVIEADEDDFTRIIKWLYTIDPKEAAIAEKIIKEEGIKKAWLPTVKLQKGKLNIDLLQPPTPEVEYILLKMGAAFDLAYKRYLDLQNAEAQAREAQIEAGLERVRARAMAMHTSQELEEVAHELRTQIGLLGADEQLETCAINLYEESEENVLVWGATRPPNSNNEIFDYSFYVPKAGITLIEKMLQAYNANMQEYLLKLEGTEMIQWLKVLEQVKPDLFSMVDEVIEFTHTRQHTAWFSCAFFKGGTLIMITFTEPDHQSRILLRRFAHVFGLAYQRYADLKQAEAQAKEAQIEASLERVRAKAMSMHKTEDLNPAVAIVFDELRKLNLGMSRCGIGIIDKERRTANAWITSIGDVGTTVQISGEESLDLHPLLQGAFSAWLKQEDYSYVLSGSDMVNYYNTSGTGNVRLPESQLILSEKDLHQQYYHLVSFEAGALFAFRDTAFPEEAKTVMKRFANVFNLTYKRFLDLQKAEAQTKEAQIEASLERIRAKAMAMHSSQDLADTIGVFYKELHLYSITPRRCGVGLLNKESKDGELFTWNTTEHGDSLELVGKIKLEGHPVLENVYSNWQSQTEYHPVLRGNEIRDYYKVLRPQMAFPDYSNDEVQFGYFFFFKEGGVYAWTNTEMKEDELNIYRRFNSVLSLTYKRYKDLQLAEEHALQAEQDLQEIKAARRKAEEALVELKTTQQQLIQSEKMASLGELTAGIAHEIQNPLNFVNNFSEVSNELIIEMKEELKKGNQDEAIQIADDVKHNLEKINFHGKRADAIVKSMLQHSRSSSSQKELIDVNVLADEYLRLAYHGFRAKDTTFNAKLETHPDPNAGKVNMIPQEMGRVILNLINNAIYAVNERKKHEQEGYEPTIVISTQRHKDKVEIRVKDNGNGIPQKLLDKIFQPFFTTKPTGEGTGLGLSLSYDIITKGHGGELKVTTREGQGSEFIIQLPVLGTT